jgi:hypothetical protein
VPVSRTGPRRRPAAGCATLPTVRRFESSNAGRILLTLVMAALVLAVIVFNAPDGPATDRAKPWANRVLYPIGLDQDWSVFAPDPRAFTVGVYAVITRPDGSRVIWHPPAKGHVFAPYRTYRWQKYVERLRADDESQLWAAGARAIAHSVGGPVRSVVLWRTFRDTVVPGSAGPRPTDQRYAFYRLRFPS